MDIYATDPNSDAEATEHIYALKNLLKQRRSKPQKNLATTNSEPQAQASSSTGQFILTIKNRHKGLVHTKEYGLSIFYFRNSCLKFHLQSALFLHPYFLV